MEKLYCCVCGKLIKKKFRYIGKNRFDVDLYRHEKCKLYKLTEKEILVIKNKKL